MIKYLLPLSILLTLFGCRDNDPSDNFVLDPAVQRQIDIDLINEYILENGYADFQVDTTVSGARYIILDYGDTLTAETSIEDNDSVRLDYTGVSLDDIVFSTSVDSVATDESIELDPPLSILYLESGENIEGTYIPGFAEGVIETFKEVGVGSHILFLLPSDLAFGNVPLSVTRIINNEIVVVEIPENSPLVWKVSPFEVKKQ